MNGSSLLLTPAEIKRIRGIAKEENFCGPVFFPSKADLHHTHPDSLGTYSHIHGDELIRLHTGFEASNKAWIAICREQSYEEAITTLSHELGHHDQLCLNSCNGSTIRVWVETMAHALERYHPFDDDHLQEYLCCMRNLPRDVRLGVGVRALTNSWWIEIYKLMVKPDVHPMFTTDVKDVLNRYPKTWVLAWQDLKEKAKKL